MAHTADPPLPGAGSCIFLHSWRGPGQGTLGCTALDFPELVAIVRWLDPRAHPVLVQLPRAAARRLRRRWGLPRV